MGFTERLPNGKFRARWFDPTGRQRSRTFVREKEAAQFLRNTMTDIDRGTYVDDKAGKVTFGEYVERHASVWSTPLARTTAARDHSYLSNHVLPRWGKVRLNRITKSAVELWIVDLGKPGSSKRTLAETSEAGLNHADLAPATILEIYQVFAKIMRAAFDDGFIPRLPLPRQRPIARKKLKPVRFLSEHELALLASKIDPRFEAMIYVAGYGGFRIGELLALRLDDVDWDRASIRVDEGLTDLAGTIAFENPKTARGRRVVPIADLALEHLRAHVDDVVRSDEPTTLLFTAANGQPLRPTNWRSRQFAKAVTDAKLAPLTPHDLRHTAASLFISAGANPWMLAEILGHGDTRMIDRVYGHLFERDREDLRRRMSALARSGATPVGT